MKVAVVGAGFAGLASAALLARDGHDVTVFENDTTPAHCGSGSAARSSQGTNLALLDAVVLAQCVAQHADVASALASYTQRRRAHLHYHGQASRFLTPVFQSEQRVLPWLRDLFMGWSGSLPIAGAMSRETLVGVRHSWWRNGLDRPDRLM